MVAIINDYKGSTNIVVVQGNKVIIKGGNSKLKEELEKLIFLSKKHLESYPKRAENSEKVTPSFTMVLRDMLYESCEKNGWSLIL